MTNPVLTAPADTDWIVSLVRNGGQLSRWRVSPGSLDPETAVRRAMLAAKIGVSDVSEVSYRRAYEHLGVVTADLDNQFRTLMEDARRRSECSGKLS